MIAAGRAMSSRRWIDGGGNIYRIAGRTSRSSRKRPPGLADAARRIAPRISHDSPPRSCSAAGGAFARVDRFNRAGKEDLVKATSPMPRVLFARRGRVRRSGGFRAAADRGALVRPEGGEAPGPVGDVSGPRVHAAADRASRSECPGGFRKIGRRLRHTECPALAGPIREVRAACRGWCLGESARHTARGL